MASRTNTPQANDLPQTRALNWLDAHTHLKETSGLGDYLDATGLHLICSSHTPEEYESFKHPQVAWTFGIHPWYAAEGEVEKHLELLKAVPILGEIGMDSVWCDVALTIQEKVFREQLAIAEKQMKLVVLHTKGQEARISQILEDYDVPYMIHWYAGPMDLPLVKNARFITLGPKPGAEALALKPSQLLLETDGLESLTWLDGKARSLDDWQPALEEAFAMLQKTLDVSAEALMNQLSRNNAALWQAARTKAISS